MQSGSLEWHQKGHAAKNNVILHKKSDYKAVKNEIALQCKRKKKKKCLWSFVSLYCVAVLLLHNEGADFLIIAGLTLGQSTFTGDGLFLSMPLFNTSDYLQTADLRAGSGALTTQRASVVGCHQVKKEKSTQHVENWQDCFGIAGADALLIMARKHKGRSKTKSMKVPHTL